MITTDYVCRERGGVCRVFCGKRQRTNGKHNPALSADKDASAVLFPPMERRFPKRHAACQRAVRGAFHVGNFGREF